MFREKEEREKQKMRKILNVSFHCIVYILVILKYFFFWKFKIDWFATTTCSDDRDKFKYQIALTTGNVNWTFFHFSIPQG